MRVLLFLLFSVNSFAVFTYRRDITVDNTKLSADVTNFPVLVSGVYSYLATTSNGGRVNDASGYDIGFYSSSTCSSGKLDWQTEKYTATTGDVVYWVKLASVSSSVPTTFYLCYGDAGITTDQSNPTAVWDSNHMAVYHFGDGTTLSTADSTSNARSLTNSGSPVAMTGKIHGGGDYSSANQYSGAAATTASFALTNATVSAWVKVNSNIANDSNPNFIFGVNTAYPHYELGWFLYTTGTSAGRFKNDTATTTAQSSALTTGVWYHAAVTYSGTTLEYFLNGVSVGTAARTSSLNTTVIRIMNGVGYGRYSNVDIDFFTVSDVARTSGWVLASYNSQNDPATFYSVSGEIVLVPFLLRRVITL
jgi:Concanavalin A-like lectin/glucanases superfamily/Domain of unknown function (DUF2341)